MIELDCKLRFMCQNIL